MAVTPAIPAFTNTVSVNKAETTKNATPITSSIALYITLQMFRAIKVKRSLHYPALYYPTLRSGLYLMRCGWSASPPMRRL